MRICTYHELPVLTTRIGRYRELQMIYLLKTDDVNFMNFRCLLCQKSNRKGEYRELQMLKGKHCFPRETHLGSIIVTEVTN